MAANITCYGSVGEIGGNKILLEDGGSRLFLDFGTSFGRQGTYYNEFLRPRPARGLLDPLVMGFIPPLEGCYREDLEIQGVWSRVMGRPEYRSLARPDGQPAVDGVLLSHAHLDHNGDISYLSKSIPVVSTRLSAFIARAMQVTGISSMEREMAYISPRAAQPSGELRTASGASYCLRPHYFLDGELSPEAADFWQNAGCGNKGMDAAKAGPASGRVGELPVCWWPVDHSIPGAVGYAIETSSGWIGYTGDIRFHGKKGRSTVQFREELAALRPSVLLCEGTHIHGDGEPLQESEIVERALSIANLYRGKLLIADFGPRNMERLFSFLEVAGDTGRMLLAQPKDIYMLEAMHKADPYGFPDPGTFPCLGMYADPKASPRGWETEVRKRWEGRITSAQAISRSPGDFILADSLWDLNDLVDLEGVSGGAYLFSNSRAYDDEQKADLARLRAWVRWMGLTLYGDPDSPEGAVLHASGHACGSQLVDFVLSVRPQVLVPVHTEDPHWWVEQLRGSGITVWLPRYGEPVQA